jgi:hypothetical protein
MGVCSHVSVPTAHVHGCAHTGLRQTVHIFVCAHCRAHGYAHGFGHGAAIIAHWYAHGCAQGFGMVLRPHGYSFAWAYAGM